MHSRTEEDGPVAASYAAARASLLGTARDLGFSISSFPIEGRGPDGEELAIDAVTLGDPQPTRAVVISSGLHGVEGFLGSAVQTAWLKEMGRSREPLPKGVSVVLVHALNPYGFAWRRRVNENNADLNRNFLLPHESYEGIPREAERLNWLINPRTPPGRSVPFVPLAALMVLRYGMKALRASLTQGQYEVEDGLFFGGTGSEATTKLVQQHFASWVREAPYVLHLDFHTGRGPFGSCRLLSDEPSGSPRNEWLSTRFAPYRVEAIGEGVAARESARGSMGHWLNATLTQQGKNYAFLNPEFGTYSGFRVFRALREENRMHRYPDAPAYERTKERLVEMFCPVSPRWREASVTTGLDLVQRAVRVCQDESWEGANAGRVRRADAR